MKRSIIFSIIFLIFFMTSCAPDLPTAPTVTKIHTMNGTIHQTDMDYPYLYIAAREAGFWQLDLSDNEFPAVKLDLLDEEQGITQALHIDAYENDVIALTERNVWRSISYGRVWYRSEYGVDRIFAPRALSRSSSDPKILCFINSGEALYTTVNWGESWQKGAPIEVSDFNESYWDPARSGEIWVNGANQDEKQFLRCFDKTTGEERDVNIPDYDADNWCSSFWFASGMTYLYTKDGTDRELIRSSDGGVSWNEINTDILDTLNIDNIFQTSSTMYLVDNDQNVIYSSTDMLNSINEVVSLPPTEEDIIEIYYVAAMYSLILITPDAVYRVDFNS